MSALESIYNIVLALPHSQTSITTANPARQDSIPKLLDVLYLMPPSGGNGSDSLHHYVRRQF